MGKSKKATVGYRYYLDWFFGVAHAIDELVTVYVDKKVAWQGSQTSSGQISINAPSLLGGDKYEGGVVGALDVCFGEATQVANDYLVSKIPGTPQPAYRNRATLVWRGGQTGANSRSPRQWSVRVRRALNGWYGPVWYPSAVVIPMDGGIKAMNPAHIVYEAITNPFWGAGNDPSLLDLDSFKASADQLVTEGFGLCVQYDQQTSVEDFIQKICDHVGAVCLPNRTTGLTEFNLIRDNYDVSQLPVLGPDDVLEFISYEVSTSTDAVNELTVVWHDPISDDDDVVTLQALGAVQGQGGVTSDSTNYAWLPTAALAARVCQRDLRMRTVPLGRLQAKFTRRASSLIGGGLFLFNWPDLGLQNEVMRIGDMDYGTLQDGSITIASITDVYSLPDQVYLAEQPSGWAPPDPTPLPSPAHFAMEAPYRDLVQIKDTASAQALPAVAGYIGDIAALPTTMSTNFDLWTRLSGGAFSKVGEGNWCPNAITVSQVSESQKAFALTGGISLDLVDIGSAAIIDDEIVRVDALDPISGVATFGRGCCDTLPAEHAAGAMVWFYDQFFAGDPSQYTLGETVEARALTVTSQATLDISLAPTDTVTIAGRAALPYPPGNVQINGASPWGQPAITGQIQLSWSHRDRLLQDDQLIDTTQSSIGPEPNTVYNFRIYDSGHNLVATQAGLSGTSATYTPATDGLYYLQLESERDGLVSLQKYQLSVTFSA